MHKQIIVAGTFSYLHEGHYKLFDQASILAKHVAIWIMDDNYAQLKDVNIKSFEFRKDCVEKVCKTKRMNFSIHKLDNDKGPILDSNYDALICGNETETVKNCDTINELRIEHHLKPLKMYYMELVCDDNKNKISSKNLR